jgi:hypothetical protein
VSVNYLEMMPAILTRFLDGSVAILELATAIGHSISTCDLCIKAALTVHLLEGKRRTEMGHGPALMESPMRPIELRLPFAQQRIADKWTNSMGRSKLGYNIYSVSESAD